MSLCLRAVLVLLLAWMTFGVCAQTSDPTRPPAMVMTPEPGGAPAVQESGLQTVILRSGGKSSAVINGQLVAVGQMMGDRRVVRITENEVVLKGPAGQEVLKAISSAEKRPTVKAGAVTRQSKGSTEK